VVEIEGRTLENFYPVVPGFEENPPPPKRGDANLTAEKRKKKNNPLFAGRDKGGVAKDGGGLRCYTSYRERKKQERLSLNQSRKAISCERKHEAASHFDHRRNTILDEEKNRRG